MAKVRTATVFFKRPTRFGRVHFYKTDGPTTLTTTVTNGAGQVISTEKSVQEPQSLGAVCDEGFKAVMGFMPPVGKFVQVTFTIGAVSKPAPVKKAGKK